MNRGKRRSIETLKRHKVPEHELTPADVDAITDHYATFHVARAAGDAEMIEALNGGVNAIVLRGMSVDRYKKEIEPTA